MRLALNALAQLLTNGYYDALTLNWAALRYKHTAAVRAVLMEKYSPAYANKMLSALRRVLKEALRLELIDALDNTGAVDFIPRLSLLEEKLEARKTRIAQMEGAISMLGQRQLSTPARRQAFTYHPPQLELQPYNEESLAKRLAVSASTIRGGAPN